MRQSARETSIGYGILIVGVAAAFYPFLSILLLSFTPNEERTGALSLPSRLTLDNYVTAWTQGGFSSALVSSAIVAAGVVVGAVALSIVAGYAFATMHFIGRVILSGFLLVGLVLPYEGIIVPLYYELQSMGLLNTYWALILPQIATSVPLGIFWMRTAYSAVPPSLADAAQVDGCSRFGMAWRIYVPLSAPAIGTLATLLFLFTWNEFLMPLVFVAQNPHVQTAPLALSFFAGATRSISPPVIAAAAVLVAVPIIVVYAILQRRFIAGIAAGAVKE